jgi:hypothetical protein
MDPGGMYMQKEIPRDPGHPLFAVRFPGMIRDINWVALVIH